MARYTLLNPKQPLALLSMMCACIMPATLMAQAPVPGYVPPVTLGLAPDYADDTRGIFVPAHPQHRLLTGVEQQNWGKTDYIPPHAQADVREHNLNRLANGAGSLQNELNRIASDPGVLNGGQGTADASQFAPLPQDGFNYLNGQQLAQINSADVPAGVNVPFVQRPQVQQPYIPPQNQITDPVVVQTADGGVELAVADVASNTLDTHNSLVRLREDRISVRRALQRMLDQIGGSAWNVVWDLDEQNLGLPEMEISIYAEEPFVNVLNALLARMQTRSGQPLRVIKYDQSRRLVVTDRTGGFRLGNQTAAVGNNFGVEDTSNAVVTERVLKDALVSLHYDEIPLVDALENIIAQAGKGQWRLRMYAGKDQVLKPAHIEEPLNIALERLLQLFNLKYEIFPGGKLVVITHANRFGYNNLSQ